MLSRVIDLSLRYRGVVLLAAAIVAVAGLASFKHLPFDAYPDTTSVQVAINTVAPALSPLEVERQITSVVEQAVSGMSGLMEVRSVSKFGFSQITAIFDDDTEVYLARQVVGERLQAVELPAGVGRPSLGPVSTGLGEVFQYLLESDELSAQELRTLHHWVVRPQMLQVPGVAGTTPGAATRSSITSSSIPSCCSSTTSVSTRSRRRCSGTTPTSAVGWWREAGRPGSSRALASPAMSVSSATS